MTDTIHGKKRFVATVIADTMLFAIAVILLVLFVVKAVSYADISPIITAAVMGISGITGAYMGLQTVTDSQKSHGGQQ